MKNADNSTMERPVVNNWEQTQREVSYAIGGSRMSSQVRFLTTNIEDLLPAKDIMGSRRCGHGSNISSCRGSLERRKTLVEKPWDGTVVANLEKIMRFQFEPLIERMVDKLRWDESSAREVFEDLKRYFYLCGTRPEPFPAPFVIDEIWHEFQMFSEQYREFCMEYIGFFVDHQPKTRHEPITDEMPIITLEAAIGTFGGLSRHWRFPTISELEQANAHGVTAQQLVI